MFGLVLCGQTSLSPEACPVTDVCCDGEAVLPFLALCILKRVLHPSFCFSQLGRLGDGIEESLSTVSFFSFSLPELRPPPSLCDQ